MWLCCIFFFFQAEDGIRDLVRSRGLGDVYKRQIANGVIGTGFAPNPDGRSTAFTLFVKSGVREAAADNSTVDFFAVHGATAVSYTHLTLPTSDLV